MSSQGSQLGFKTISLFLFAIICFSASIYVGIWHQNQLDGRATIRNTGQRTTAVAVSRSEVEFISIRGTIRAKPLVSPMQGTLQKQNSYDVIYDRRDPSRVVLIQDDSAYNITIWVVSAKLMGASLIFFWFGYRKFKKNSKSNSLS